MTAEKELLELVVDYTNGSESDSQFERLEQLLNESEDARAFFVEALNLHNSLCWRGSQHCAGTDIIRYGAGMDLNATEQNMGNFIAFPTESVGAGDEPLASGVRPTTAPIPKLSASFDRLANWPMAYLVSFAITAVALCFLDNTYISRDSQIGSRQQIHAEIHSPPAHGKIAATIGRITGVADCKLANSEIVQIGTPVRIADRYVLASGLMEISYNTGAKVLLQGPLTYEAESNNGGFMSIGKLTGKVESERAKGFSVRTPTAVITDLGTEFGVEVDRDGRTEAQVFLGAVAIVSSHPAAQKKPQVVRAGEQAAVEGQHVTVTTTVSTKSRVDRFIRKIPNPNRSTTEDAYGKFVLSMKPMVYYRMDQSDDNRQFTTIFDSGPSHSHGTFYQGDDFGQPWLHGRIGKSLAFRGPEINDYAIIPNYPKTTTGQLTVAAWVMAESRQDCWTMIAANWLCSVHGQFHLGISEDGDLAAAVSDIRGKRIMVREGKQQPFPLHEWQHVACTADGARLRLYREGQEVGATPCQGVLASSPVSTLTIGFKDDNDAPSKSAPLRRYFWTGRIDELVIFDRPFSATEMLSLREAAEKSQK